jgi:hypothetical protein
VGKRVIETMDDTLLNTIRNNWVWLAVVGCTLWIAQSLIAGSTILQALVGPLMVCVWATAIFLIDRWIALG